MRIHYQNIEGDKLNDGKSHSVLPKGLCRIEDLNLYLFEYYDVDAACSQNAILKIEDENVIRLPLRSYNSLFEMIKSGNLRLNSVVMDQTIIKKLTDDKTLVESEGTLGNIEAALSISRPAIILLIDSFDDIYCKDGKNFVKLDKPRFFYFLRMYDIKWLRKETTSLPTSKEIEEALNKIITGSSNNHQTFCEKRYMINNIYHYSIGYNRRKEESK